MKTKGKKTDINNEGESVEKDPDPPQSHSVERSSDVQKQLEEHSKILASLKDLPGMVLSLQERIQNFQSDPVSDEEEGEFYEESEDDLNGLLNDLKSHDKAKSDSTVDDPDESLMDILKDSEESIEYDDPITEKVAKSFQQCISRPLSKETFEKLKSKMKAPENCKLLLAPRVNPEVWNILPNSARTSDFKLQQTQNYLSYGLVTLSKIANMVTLNSSKLPATFAEEVLRLAVNGGNMLGNGFQEMSSRRRHGIKPDLNQDYAAICSQRLPASELLFGTDLKESLKASKTVTHLVKRPSGRYRPKPYARPPNLGNKFQGNFNRPPQKFKKGGRFQQQRPQSSNFRPSFSQKD